MRTPVTFVSHTNKPGGGELALRRYLEATTLPTRLVTLESGGVWEGLATEIVPVTGALGLRRALKGGGLIVANSMRAAFLTALVAPRRSRLVYWVRDGLTDSAMSPLALALTKHVTARRVRHYFTNSQWTAQTIRESLDVAESQIDSVPSLCGIGEHVLHRPPRPYPHTPLRLLYLGRISTWKGPDIAVRALPEIRERTGVEATLTIAGGVHFGERKYADRLRELVSRERGATMIGHVENVQSLFDTHDILVHCSTAPEPFGQVVVQGLAAGLPVVATGQGGPLELLAGAPVRLCYTAGDESSLAEAVARALARYEETSAWALNRAQNFTDARLLAGQEMAIRKQAS